MKLGDPSTIRKLPTEIQKEVRGSSLCAGEAEEWGEEKSELSELKI